MDTVSIFKSRALESISASVLIRPINFSACSSGGKAGTVLALSKYVTSSKCKPIVCPIAAISRNNALFFAEKTL